MLYFVLKMLKIFIDGKGTITTFEIIFEHFCTEYLIISYVIVIIIIKGTLEYLSLYCICYCFLEHTILFSYSTFLNFFLICES